MGAELHICSIQCVTPVGESTSRIELGYEKLPGGDHSNTMAIAGNLRRLPESKIRRKRNLVPMYFVVDDDHSDDGTIPSRLDVLTLVD
jgi:hypothetical protein